MTESLTPKAFLTKNLKRGRKQLYTELRKSGYLLPEYPCMRSESLRDLTDEQLVTSEGSHPNEND